VTQTVSIGDIGDIIAASDVIVEGKTTVAWHNNDIWRNGAASKRHHRHGVISAWRHHGVAGVSVISIVAGVESASVSFKHRIVT